MNAWVVIIVIIAIIFFVGAIVLEGFAISALNQNNVNSGKNYTFGAIIVTVIGIIFILGALVVYYYYSSPISIQERKLVGGIPPIYEKGAKSILSSTTPTSNPSLVSVVTR